MYCPVKSIMLLDEFTVSHLQDNGDGIIVRTIKSRILERGDRNERDRGRRDRGAESKQQQAQNKGGGDAREEPSGNNANRSGNKDGEPSDRDRKRAERNAERKAAIALKEAARRKEKKLRRNERENNRKEDRPVGSAADIGVEKADVEAPTENVRGDSGRPVVKEERTRKYSESRRERRASRNENRKAENEAAIAQTKDAGGEEILPQSSKDDVNNDPKEIVEVKENIIDDTSTKDPSLEKVSAKVQSQTSIDDDENASRRDSFDSKQDSSSGGENSRDTSNAKRERDMKRIRNKVNTIFIEPTDFDDRLFSICRIVHLYRSTSRVAVNLVPTKKTINLATKPHEPLRIAQPKKQCLNQFLMIRRTLEKLM